jgi:ABC-2 type transport system ATP-binding protein
MGRPSELIGSATAEIRYRRDGELVVVETAEPTRALHELTAAALAEGREVDGLEVRRPTLEDVYLELLAEEEEELEP